MDQNQTYIQNLSSVLQNSLTAFQTPEFLNATGILQTAIQQLTSVTQLVELDSLVDSLSSIPLHPYQNLLWKHFEPGYKFKTIDDIPEPDAIPTTECLRYISKKEQEISKTIFHNLTCCPEHQLHSAFEFLSGEQIVCNIEKQKNYIEFIEMLRQIPLDSITLENSNVLTKKIVAEYMRVL